MNGSHPENPLWEYSVSVYAKSGVAQTCLELQNQYHIDVNFLLYGAWLASIGQVLNKSHLQALDEEVFAWREQVIHPLRSMREELPKDGPAAAVREQMLEIELQAERREQDILYTLWQVSSLCADKSASIGSNLVVVAEHFSTDAKPALSAITCLADQIKA